MDEKKGESTENNGEGDQPKSLDKVERAEQAVKRMEETEKRLDEKIARLAELQADRLLGGTAGIRVESEPPKEETAKEYSDRIMRGDLK